MDNPIKKLQKKAEGAAINTKSVGLSGNDKVALISNLTTMLSAGIPILDTVDSLLTDSKGNQKKFLTVFRDDLMKGQRVHTTFAKFPRIFDNVAVNILKASEEAGTMDVALSDLKDNIKREMEFNDKIKSALVYPGFILVVFVGVMLMILVVVVPKIVTVFSRLNTPLPLPTKILIFMSDALLHNTIPVLIGTSGLIAGIVYLFKNQRKKIVRVFTSFPVISKFATEIDLTRVCRNLFLMLSAGIPITSALVLTKDVVNKKEVYDLIIHTQNVVTQGKPLSDAFKDGKHILPTVITKIIEAGEKSGSMDEAFKEAAEFMDYQVQNSLKTLTALIEPAMLVMVGVLIGGMMLAIIAPIYGMIGSIGPHS